ncbi:zinc finger domain-containing protein [Micromonospora sp. IBHARD004]|uniref:zinc finger domain-containing protein n=1 Tax=Micromonospora sp. IBHARD004 TaxID=3457764 RepID=UPI0040594BBC
MPLIDMPSEQAQSLFWEGMQEVAEAATRHRDEELFDALRKIGKAAVSQGIEPVPQGGRFLRCPVCGSAPGQLCLSTPGHPLKDHFHPERVDLVGKILTGEVAMEAVIQ